MNNTDLIQNVHDNYALPQDVIAQAISSLDEAITNLSKYTNVVFEDDLKKKKGITIRNEQTVRNALKFAKEYPQFVSPSIDVELWEEDLKNINDAEPLLIKAKILIDLVIKYQRISGVEALRYFNFYYRTMRTLSNEGVEEAKVIYDTLSKIYSYRFGPRAKENYSVQQIESTMEEAHRVLSANRAAINNVIADEQKLKQLLDKDLDIDEKA